MTAEELMEKLNEYLETKEIKSNEDYEQAVREFMEHLNETEIEMFFQSMNQEDESEEDVYYNIPEDSAKRIAYQTLEKDTTDYAARNYLTATELDLDVRLSRYASTIEMLKLKLDEKNFFTDEVYMGSFWVIPETRPYMRTNYYYFLTLIELERYEEAVSLAETMIDLARADQLGFRYTLASLYALLEDDHKLKHLQEFYLEDSLRMLLPSALLYYKQGMLEEAGDVLAKLKDSNPFFVDYVKGKVFLTDEEMDDIEDSEGYLHGTIDEVYLYLLEMEWLFETTDFLDWVRDEY